MISKELRRLSRRELVDIIYQMKKKEQRMQEEIAALKDALNDKRLRLSEAGSIAEAAVSITDLFSAAQKTADLYLQEISYLKEATERECARVIGEAHAVAAKMRSDEENKLLVERLKRNQESDEV